MYSSKLLYSLREDPRTGQPVTVSPESSSRPEGLAAMSDSLWSLISSIRQRLDRNLLYSLREDPRTGQPVTVSPESSSRPEGLAAMSDSLWSLISSIRQR